MADSPGPRDARRGKAWAQLQAARQVLEGESSARGQLDSTSRASLGTKLLTATHTAVAPAKATAEATRIKKKIQARSAYKASTVQDPEPQPANWAQVKRPSKQQKLLEQAREAIAAKKGGGVALPSTRYRVRQEDSGESALQSRYREDRERQRLEETANQTAEELKELRRRSAQGTMQVSELEQEVTRLVTIHEAATSKWEEERSELLAASEEAMEALEALLAEESKRDELAVGELRAAHAEQLAGLRAECDQTAQELEIARQSHTEKHEVWTQQISSLEMEARDKQGDLERKQAEVERLTLDMESIRKSLECGDSSLRALLERTTSQLAEERESRAKFEEQAQVLRGDSALLNRQLEEMTELLTTTTEEAQEAVKARDAALLELQPLKELVPELKLQRESMSQLLDGSTSDASSWEGKWEAAQGRATELELLNAELKQELNLKSTELEKAEQGGAVLEETLGKCQETFAERDDYEEVLQMLRSTTEELASANQRLSTVDSEFAELRKQLMSSESEVEARGRSIDQLVEDLRVETLTRERALAMLQEEMGGELDELTEQLEAAREAENHAQALRSATQEMSASLTDAMQPYVQNIEAKAQVAHAEARAAEAEKQVALIKQRHQAEVIKLNEERVLELVATEARIHNEITEQNQMMHGIGAGDAKHDAEVAKLRGAHYREKQEIEARVRAEVRAEMKEALGQAEARAVEAEACVANLRCELRLARARAMRRVKWSAMMRMVLLCVMNWHQGMVDHLLTNDPDE